MQINRKSPPGKGFTLIELLVVIAIIAVLASLVFVGGRSALLKSRSADSINNLKEINVSLISLSEEQVHNGKHLAGFYPPVAGHESAPRFSSFTWLDLIAASQGFAELEGTKYVWETDPKDTFMQNPLSNLEFGGDGDSWDVLYNNKDALQGSYILNYQISSWAASHSPNPTMTPLGGVPFPSTTIIVGEAQDGWGQAHLAPFNSRGVPGGNYKDSAHVLFVDGHIELVDNEVLKTAAGRDYYMLLDGPGKTRKP